MSTLLFALGLTVSIIINILLYKALSNQLKRTSLYEEWIKEYDNWIGDVRNMISSTYIKMKGVDEKGLFFKDDDVGFVFSELLDLLKQLNDKIQK